MNPSAYNLLPLEICRTKKCCNLKLEKYNSTKDVPGLLRFILRLLYDHFHTRQKRRIGYKSAVLLTYTPCLDELNYAFTNLIFPAS